MELLPVYSGRVRRCRLSHVTLLSICNSWDGNIRRELRDLVPHHLLSNSAIICSFSDIDRAPVVCQALSQWGSLRPTGDNGHLTVYPDGRRPEQNPGLLTSGVVLFCFLLLGMLGSWYHVMHIHTGTYPVVSTSDFMEHEIQNDSIEKCIFFNYFQQHRISFVTVCLLASSCCAEFIPHWGLYVRDVTSQCSPGKWVSLSHTAGHVGHWPPSTQPVGCGPGIPGQVCLYPRSVTEISPTESSSLFSRLESLRHMVY